MKEGKKSEFSLREDFDDGVTRYKGERGSRYAAWGISVGGGFVPDLDGKVQRSSAQTASRAESLKL